MKQVVRVGLLLIVFLLLSCSTEPQILLPKYRVDLWNTGVQDTEPLLTTPRIAWKYKTYFWIFSSATADARRVYFSGVDGNVYALNQQTGKREWRFVTTYRVYSTPTLYGPYLYVGRWQGALHGGFAG